MIKAKSNKKIVLGKNTIGKHRNICFKCKRPIDELNDNFLKLISYNDGEVFEEVWFHLSTPKGNCWGEYNDMRMSSRLGEMASKGFGMLKEMGMDI